MDLKFKLDSCWFLPRYKCSFVALGIYCHACYCCVSWSSYLGKTVDLGACIAPSGATKASQQGRNFKINSSLISLDHESKMCGIFKNRVLLSSSGGQPRGMERTCIVLWSSGTSLTSNSLVSIPPLALLFCIIYSF